MTRSLDHDAIGVAQLGVDDEVVHPLLVEVGLGGFGAGFVVLFGGFHQIEPLLLRLGQEVVGGFEWYEQRWGFVLVIVRLGRCGGLDRSTAFTYRDIIKFYYFFLISFLSPNYWGDSPGAPGCMGVDGNPPGADGNGGNKPPPGPPTGLHGGFPPPPGGCFGGGETATCA